MSEAPVPEISVEPDHFDVVTSDVVLVARLESTFALCLYDAVLESGALIHLRVAPPGRVQDPESHRHHAIHRPAAARSLLRRAAQERAARAALAGESRRPGSGPAGRARALRRRPEFPLGVSRRCQREAGFLRYPRGPRAIAADSVPQWVTFAASPLPLSASVAENRRHAPKNSCLAGPPRGVAHRRCRARRQEARQRAAAQAVRNQLAGGPGRRSDQRHRARRPSLRRQAAAGHVGGSHRQAQPAHVHAPGRAAQDRQEQAREGRPAQLRPVRARDQASPRRSPVQAVPVRHAHVRRSAAAARALRDRIRSRRSRTTTTGSRASTRAACTSTSGSCC